jgi:crotonobetainyl-CoA:carnitine CoA-transferase CaiB-like acyl-CoA transferase
MGLLFEGLKVIDCGSFIAAPAAATILSDFGADVIKIEPPGAGDPYRHLTKLPGHPKSDQNYAWMLGSRNKRSLAGGCLHHQLSRRGPEKARHRL